VGKWTAQGGLPQGLDKPDVVIVDPPRAGLSPDVPEQIHALDPQKIIYVSCNPSTLARDLKVFQALGYTVDVVQPVDMFPQTYHIETVVRLRRV
jgi:23S rRNA (uracil1939-C5)-methyltransferase